MGRVPADESDITGTPGCTQAAVNAGVKQFSISATWELTGLLPIRSLRPKPFPRNHSAEWVGLYHPEDSHPLWSRRWIYHWNYRSAWSIQLLLREMVRRLLQPFWIEDLIACLTWSMDDPAMHNLTIEVNLQHPLQANCSKRDGCLWQTFSLVSLSAGYTRRLTLILEAIFPRLPITNIGSSTLSVNRTCALDTARY